MTLKLYKADLSPPARAVMMACDIFNIPTEMIEIDLLNKEQLTPDFLKLSPIHTVPVLVDGDLVIQDSNATLMYLSDKYGKDDSLYPKDLIKRTLINQKLFLSNSTYFGRLRNMVYQIRNGGKEFTQAQIDETHEAYDFLENFLSKTKYVALDQMTIADLAYFTLITNLRTLVPFDEKDYPKIIAWVKNLEEQPYSKKYNEAGSMILKNFITETWSK